MPVTLTLTLTTRNRDVYTLVVNNNQYWKTLSALKDMCILVSIQMVESNSKTCAMCGRPARNTLLLHAIGDCVTYTFDSEECARTFKKFYDVYGKHFTSLLD